jgi:hypothetical protein
MFGSLYHKTIVGWLLNTPQKHQWLMLCDLAFEE